MKKFTNITCILLFTISIMACSNTKTSKSVETEPIESNISANSVYDFSMISIEGEIINLSKYKGKVLVIVNTASKCGLTPQYKELEAFYKTYKEKGVEVLGFPANNFLSQEPGTNKEIANFCLSNYGVSFQMFSKISVKGKDIHPLYQYLTQKSKNGILDAAVSWNFQKFVIDQNGKLITSFSPKTSVSEPEFIKTIDDLLKK